MNPLFYLALGGLFAGLIASRILMERAMRLLSDAEKLTLLSSFSRLRAFGSVPLIAVSVMFFAMTALPSRWLLPGYFLGWVLLAAFIVWQHFYVHRRLKELGIAAGYRAALRRAQWCSRAGFFTAFVCITVAIFR